MTKKEARALVLAEAKRAVVRAVDFGDHWVEFTPYDEERSMADVQRIRNAVEWFAHGAITVRPGGNGGAKR